MHCLHPSRSSVKPRAACVRALSITETPSMKAHASPGRARERQGSPSGEDRSSISKPAPIATSVHPLVRDVNFKWILNSPSVFLVKRNHGRWQRLPRSIIVVCPSYVTIAGRRTRRPVARVAAFGPLLGRDQPSGRMRRNRRASRAPTHQWEGVRHIPGPVAHATR